MNPPDEAPAEPERPALPQRSERSTHPGPRARPAWHLGVVVVLLLAALVAPDPTPLGAARLAVFALLVAGSGLLVGRAGAADLSAAGAAGAGAYLGAVGAALAGWPVLVGLPLAAAAGAVVGAASGALHVRVGRALGALTSLALTAGAIAALGAWPAAGGVSGFHAVPLLTTAGLRAELAITGVLTIVGLAAAASIARSKLAAAAALAVTQPAVASSLGRRPVVDGTFFGAGAGALLGTGGALLAAIDGSVTPGAYGLQLSAAVALAALLGGAAPLGPAVGAVLVWGPGTVWPLVPLIGTAPPLLVMGPLGLVVLALRRGRPLVPARAADQAAASAPTADPSAPTADPSAPTGDLGPRAPQRRVHLELRAAMTPCGPLDLEVHPGEIVALTGPNGAGKSTILARIAGQLPDAGAVVVDGHRPPHGDVARARAGIRRTWQRMPEVRIADLDRLVAADPAAARAAAWARRILMGEASPPLDGTPHRSDSTPHRSDGTEQAAVQQLVQLVASGPAIALLDEPTGLDPDRLAVLLRALAQVGTGVLIVDHRPEVLTSADRVVRLEPMPVDADDEGVS